MLITSLTRTLRMPQQQQRTTTKILRKLRRSHDSKIQPFRLSNLNSTIHHPRPRHLLIMPMLLQNPMRINIQGLSPTQCRQLRQSLHQQSTHSQRHALQYTIVHSQTASRLMLHQLTNRLRMLLNGLPHELRHLATTNHRRRPIRIAKNVIHRSLNRLSHTQIHMQPRQRRHRFLNLLQRHHHSLLTTITSLSSRRPNRTIRMPTTLIVPSMQPLTTSSRKRVPTLLMNQITNRIRPRITTHTLNNNINAKLNRMLQYTNRQMPRI